MPARPTPLRRHDDEVVARILAGETYREVAGALALSVNQVARALQRRDVRLSREERARRVTRNLDAVRADPAAERRRVDALRRARVAWPECPPHLTRDYETLRNYHGARRAREMLEARPRVRSGEAHGL